MLYISQNLTALRNHYQLRLEDVAGLIDVSRQTLSKYEKGQAVPPTDVAGRLAIFYKVTLDTLAYHDLSRLTTRQFEQLLASPDPAVRGQTLRIRELIRTVGEDNEENIELVPVKAAMGYCQGGYSDETFIAELPAFRLPLPVISKERKYRLFPAGGDSMLPIPSNAYVLGEYVEDWYSIKDGGCYVVICEEGIVVKKVINQLTSQRRLVLHSLNPAYEPYELPVEQVRELWKYVLYLTTDFPDPEPTLGAILGEIRQLRNELKKPHD
ncbi:XRE family transcriptional regulator [Tellurirhabdus bombi]|uniref:XRE family transcriptional regulator n=1 Tax=Tellurirhabdus bombi TaxID=2907205 RepID=UPI001F393ED8|nr:LexA family transcriptional regulator [Tellurirhabdus bombi]